MAVNVYRAQDSWSYPEADQIQVDENGHLSVQKTDPEGYAPATLALFAPDKWNRAERTD